MSKIKVFTDKQIKKIIYNGFYEDSEGKIRHGILIDGELYLLFPYEDCFPKKDNKEKVSRIETNENIIKEIIREKDKEGEAIGMEMLELISEMSEEEIKPILRKLMELGEVYEPSKNKYRWLG